MDPSTPDLPPALPPAPLRWRREGSTYRSDLGSTWHATLVPVHQRRVWKAKLHCVAGALLVEGPASTAMTLGRARRWVEAMRPALGAIACAGADAWDAIFPPPPEATPAGEVRPSVMILCEREGLFAAIRTIKRGGGAEFPGGKIEPGESPCKAAMREAAEELGVPVRVHPEPLLAFEHAFGGQRWHCTAFLGTLDGPLVLGSPEGPATWATREELLAGPFGDIYPPLFAAFDRVRREAAEGGERHACPPMFARSPTCLPEVARPGATTLPAFEGAVAAAWGPPTQRGLFSSWWKDGTMDVEVGVYHGRLVVSLACPGTFTDVWLILREPAEAPLDLREAPASMVTPIHCADLDEVLAVVAAHRASGAQPSGPNLETAPSSSRASNSP